MAWILLEGLDRSGKSTVAKHYESKGYLVVHMSAPDKKYMQPGYVGPSYFEEIYELYMRYNKMDVVFDRTQYGETVWPHIYDRKPCLSEEEIQDLREVEFQNKAQYLFMTDPDVKGHWDRCVANNEPLTRDQFKMALSLYRQLASRYGFKEAELPVFLEKNGIKLEDIKKNDVATDIPHEEQAETEVQKQQHSVSNREEFHVNTNKTPEQARLEEANAINSILNQRIIKKKGLVYDKLEDEVRKFLNSKLGAIFGRQADNFSDKEVQILKTYCQLIQEKEKNSKRR